MQIIISSRHMELSDALEAAVHDKVGRLERFDHDVSLARVHFTHEPTARAADREHCEVLLEGKGEQFVSRTSGPDGFAAVDLAAAKLEQQLTRQQDRRAERRRRQ
jgi:ribosomal subunit interface protein